MATEKVVQPNYSAEKKSSINKIIIRGGGITKELSPEKNNYFNHNIEKVCTSEKTVEP